MATEVQAVLPDTGLWSIDPSHSSVRFKVANIAVTTYVGMFSEYGGSFDAEAGSLTGWVKADSIQTFEPLRSRLLEPDFFDAADHPEMTFASSSISTEEREIVIDGELTIAGSSNPVRAAGTFGGPVTVMFGEERHDHIGMDLRVEIDRRKFGLEYNMELPNGALNLGWDVVLEFALDFVHKETAA